MNNKDKENKEDLDQVIKDLAIQVGTNYKKVNKELNKVKTNKGGMNSKQIWSLKKSLCPKSKDLQTGLTAIRWLST